MRGLLVINAYPNGEKFLRQSTRIAEELQKLDVTVDILRSNQILARIDGEGNAWTDLVNAYDFCVYLDKDKYLGRLLEKKGLRLFNRAKAVEICDDKIVTYLALMGAEIPLIETIPAPLCYTPNAKVDEKHLQSVAKILGFPMVVKKSYGSFGEGVQLVHGMPELQKAAQELLYQPHCFQKYISHSCGKDIRVMVVGGKAVASMERVAKEGEFRSNVELGGVGRTILLSKECQTLAEKTAKTLDLDYCGVDILQTEKGAVVCEVNSNAFFEGLEKTTGVNVAAIYARHIVNTMK